jgi:hypothetical protein
MAEYKMYLRKTNIQLVIVMLIGLMLTACVGGSSSNNLNTGNLTSRISYTILVPEREGQSVARKWNEVILLGVRNNFTRLITHAGNLLHISSAMFDAWSVHKPQAKSFLLGSEVAKFPCPSVNFTLPEDVLRCQEQAIRLAAYWIIQHRFTFSPSSVETIAAADIYMQAIEFSLEEKSLNYAQGSAVVLGRYIANESSFYVNTSYQTVNFDLALCHSHAGHLPITDLNSELTLD